MFCTQSVRYRNIANIDADSTNAAIDAPQNDGLAEQREVEHRVPHAALDDDERDQQQRRRQQQATITGAPALRVAADEREDEQEQRGGERDRPSQSTPPACGSLRLGHAPAASAQIAATPDRDVDEEDRLPADRLDEHAADQRADRDGAADRGAPDAERGAAVAAL